MAVSTLLIVGLLGEIVTEEMTGAVSPMVTTALVTALPFWKPSLGVTFTVMLSLWMALPDTVRVLAVAPLIGVLPSYHW